MTKMLQLEKLEGVGNVQMTEADIPAPASDEVQIKVRRSLISRGSELFRRYVMPEAVPTRMMGYSDAGDVTAVGTAITDVSLGERSNLSGPHAQYAVGQHGTIPDTLDYETATFIGLATSATMWARTTPIEPGEDVVVLGQGIVGNLYMQAVRERQPGRVITVDATALRCQISQQCGADTVINVAETDSVQAVKDLTDGKGADVVVECVGGKAGIKSFGQAQQMLKRDGVLHLIALYQGAKKPGDGVLEIDSGLFMSKLLVAGIRVPEPREHHRADAIQKLVDGDIRVAPMVTHRMPWQQTADAYHFLYEHPEEAMAVILEWD
jgi:threonine dehydrogenase-like Zn-dependent dehydrogenase